jgi:glycosyltransferase involved in cell wall biosynthesis
MGSPLRILSFVEGTTVTGPIKPLLAFHRYARESALVGGRSIVPRLVTTVRGPATHEPDNALIRSARGADLPIDTLRERFALDLKLIPQLITVIETQRPHIVESHNYKPHLLVALARRHSGHAFRWLAYHHGYTTESMRVRAYNQLDRWSLPRADRVVTLCGPFAEQIKARGVRGDGIDILKNAIEERSLPSPEDRASARHALGLATDDMIILCIGRLSKEKGHERLVAAATRLLAARPEGKLRFVIVGEGPERSRLRSLARPLGDRLIFAGFHADTWPFYCAASAFVLPSYTEGSPMVLLEAMQAGLPIVATRVGGIPEMVVDGETAVLVGAGDTEALFRGLLALAGDGALRARLATAARTAVSLFSIPRYSDRLVKIYEHVLAGT